MKKPGARPGLEQLSDRWGYIPSRFGSAREIIGT